MFGIRLGQQSHSGDERPPKSLEPHRDEQLTLGIIFSIWRVTPNAAVFKGCLPVQHLVCRSTGLDIRGASTRKPILSLCNATWAKGELEEYDRTCCETRKTGDIPNASLGQIQPYQYPI
jgi:hypothetical protein